MFRNVASTPTKVLQLPIIAVHLSLLILILILIAWTSVHAGVVDHGDGNFTVSGTFIPALPYVAAGGADTTPTITVDSTTNLSYADNVNDFFRINADNYTVDIQAGASIENTGYRSIFVATVGGSLTKYSIAGSLSTLNTTISAFFAGAPRWEIEVSGLLKNPGGNQLALGQGGADKLILQPTGHLWVVGASVLSAIEFRGGNDEFIINGGTLDLPNPVDFGDGNDRLELNAAPTGTAEMLGGSGTDTVQLNNSGSYSLTALASGWEQLEMNGAAWTLSGFTANTFSGGVALNAGNLTLDATGGDTTISGAVTGTGSLTKTGAGTLTLTGSNTYNGGTTVSAGTLQGTTTSLQGAITNNANVTFDQTTTGTYAGTMSGTGNLIKKGTGTVTLSGANTYSGGTTVSAGILQGTTTSAQGDIINSAAVVFDQATDGTYAGVMSGSGSLIKSNTGTVILSGVNTYSGATAVNGGTLVVNGSNSNSATTVNTGATLGGTGAVGSVTISGGTFAPGNSIGTTNVTGNVDFTGGGNYDVEVDAAGNSDLINATGTATLTSGTVNVQPEEGSYAIATDYTILTATGGLGGTTFNSVNSSLAFLTPSMSYDANNVFLTLTRNDVSFTEVAGTPNQSAVATVLDNNQSALSEIVDDLLVLTDAGTRQAFDSLGGVQHTAVQSVMLVQGRQFMNILSNRFGGVTTGSLDASNPRPGSLLAYNGDDWVTMASATAGMPLDEETEREPERGWWVRGYGQVGDIDDTSNATGSDYHLFGTAVGIDTELREGLITGAALGVAVSDVNGIGYDADVTSYQLATYAGWEQNEYYLNGTVSAGYHDSDASRQIPVGSTTSTAASDYSAVNISTDVEGGKRIELKRTTTLTPFAEIDYSHLHRDGFTETGAGTSNLAVRDQYENSLRTKLGVEISHTLKTNQGGKLKPSARIAYVHEYLDNVSQLDAGFNDAPDAMFTVDGPDLDRNRMALNIFITAELSERSQFYLEYDAEIAHSDDHHAFSAAFQYRW